MGIQLAQGDYDFTIFERGDGFGGTWRNNTYPGAACDVAVALLLVFVRAESSLLEQDLTRTNPRSSPIWSGSHTNTSSVSI